MSKDRYHFQVNINDYIIARVDYEDEYSKTYLVKNKTTSEFALAYVAACEPFDETKSIKIYEKACDEIDAMIHFQHQSFLKIIGFSPIDFQKEKRITVFTEYYGKNLSKLDDYYKKKFNVDKYTNTSRQILLIGIARGLMLLHKTNFLHCFLNPDNIYLDKNHNPHLGQTFFSNFSNDDSIFCDILNHIVYVAPEVANTFEFTQKSDVYSLGMIMYMIITNSEAFDELGKKKKSPMLPNIILKEGIKPQFKCQIKPTMKKLIERCLTIDPIDRPTSEEIYNSLAYSNNYYLDDVDFGAIQVYINEIEDDIYLPHCYSCQNRIKYTETIFYSGYPFHKECVKCIVCDKSLKTNQNINEFVCITNGIFFCKSHYDAFKNTHQLPPNIMTKIKNKCKQNVIDDLFKSNFFNDVDVLNQNPNNVFITFDMVENSYQNNKPYESFIPNITFHFERFSDKIDFNKLEKVFQKDMIIIGIDRGSTILKTAYLAMKN